MEAHISENFIHTNFCGEDMLMGESVSDPDRNRIALRLAMETEIASLKYTMTSKRRAEAHNFILECFDRLK